MVLVVYGLRGRVGVFVCVCVYVNVWCMCVNLCVYIGGTAVFCVPQDPSTLFL